MHAPDAAIGRLIGGKYRLGEMLAVGGMGLVFAGAHEGTGRAVAIKLLRAELMTRRDIVRRVSKEARLAVEASHPNVVEVLDAGTDDEGVPYLVLERLYGRPLEALLAQPLPLLTTAQALVPVANAVATLHRVGIVHRDVKPANIFLHRGVDGRVTPKLLDFGIAKALAPSGPTFTGAALGTPAYMAPEQALGYNVGGPAADVWSMAVVFVRCLTGRLPFANVSVARGTSSSTVLRRELSHDIPDSLTALLVRALAFEPSERPEDMTVFRDELLEALASTDGHVPWPGEGSISFPASEFDLADAIGVDAVPVRQACTVLARPCGVHTRTLTGLQPLARIGRKLASHSVFSRLALLSIAALSIASAALVSWSADQRGSNDAIPVPEREQAEPARAMGALPLSGVAPLELATPLAPSDVAPFASPSAPSPRAATAAPPTAAAAARARRSLRPKLEPRAPPGRRGKPRATRDERGGSSSLRVGANRSPIIE